MDDIDQDNYGWKIISTDVFRFPPYKSLLCATIGGLPWRHNYNCSLSFSLAGNGCQFLALSVAIIVMALLGVFNVHRHHAMNSTAVLLYAFTCCIAGYISANLFKKIGGQNWVWNIILTTSFFSVPFFLVWSFVNTVAWIHQSTQALPFTTIILIMCMWLMGKHPPPPPSLTYLLVPSPLSFSWLPPYCPGRYIWEEHGHWI